MTKENADDAPERIWLPRKDSPLCPNADFYSTQDHEDDVEYIRADLVPFESELSAQATREREAYFDSQFAKDG